MQRRQPYPNGSPDCHAETFECFELKGTPSYILVDKHGVLRDCTFGAYPELESRILKLLQEKNAQCETYLGDNPNNQP